MNRYIYRGKYYTTKELSEMSGVPSATIRDRIRRGYSIEEAVKLAATHDSVREFCQASYYRDWIGMATTDIYTVYWRWCTTNGHSPIEHKGFTRQILAMYPMIKVVPTKHSLLGYCRIIRLKEIDTNG